MLNWLRGRGSERKLRLYACACCRQIADVLTDLDPDTVAVIGRFEDFSDGKVPSPASSLPWPRAEGRLIPTLCSSDLAWRVITGLSEESAWNAARTVMDGIIALLPGAGPVTGSSGWWVRSEAERLTQADLLRDLFEPLFHESPLRLPWLEDETVLHLARAIYADRSFREMPVLADALEDAGCPLPDWIEHCREPGVHCRGCWVVDAILGKG
jgi:hypothetical protein